MYLSSKDANTTPGTGIDPTLLNLNQVNFQPTLTQLVRWGIQVYFVFQPTLTQLVRWGIQVFLSDSLTLDSIIQLVYIC